MLRPGRARGAPRCRTTVALPQRALGHAFRALGRKCVGMDNATGVPLSHGITEHLQVEHRHRPVAMESTLLAGRSGSCALKRARSRLCLLMAACAGPCCEAPIERISQAVREGAWVGEHW